MRTRLTIKRMMNENDEIPEYANESDSEHTRINETSEIPSFILQILLDQEVAEEINSLNSKQREVFNAIHTWAKDYVKYDTHDIEQLLKFLSGSEETSKSHFIKAIYNAI